MKYKIWKTIRTASIFFTILLVLTFFLNSLAAIIINPEVQFIVGNETYTIQQTMKFERIIISDTYIIFNDTGFYVNSGKDITIMLVYLDDDIYGSDDGDKILEFYADTTSGTVTFSISGFTAGNNYIIKRSGSTIAIPTANSSGYITFVNNIWSTRLFKIFQEGEGTSDMILPEISDVNIDFLTPLDTEAGFCWENISCTVTDNVAVDQVFLNITFPDSTKDNFLMSNDYGSTYYYNTSFEEYGNYSYFIWAIDTSGNIAASSVFDFSMPPNWDINNDGVVNVFDHVLISNHYGETDNPGWIREDVDNNGQIQVLDLVIVSNHYGEIWWEE